MNTGLIASRYAAALLALTDENGSTDRVIGQVRTIQAALSASPEFRRIALDSPEVPPARKLALFEAALSAPEGSAVSDASPAEPSHQAGSEKVMAPELRRFITLLIRNGRISDLRLVFNAFVNEYYRSRKILRARLTVADGALLTGRLSLAERLRNLIETGTDWQLELQTEVDSSIIGGFVFNVEDTLLDASVSARIETIRRRLVEKNNRLI